MVRAEDVFEILNHSWSNIFLKIDNDINKSFAAMGFNLENAKALLDDGDAWDEDATPKEVLEEMWDDFIDDISREFEKDFSPIKVTDTCQSVADHINNSRR